MCKENCQFNNFEYQDHHKLEMPFSSTFNILLFYPFPLQVWLTFSKVKRF